MAYFEDYQRKPIEPGYVDKEGDYELRITGVTNGQLETGERYRQVQCEINYKGTPRISIFLTEGKNFDGNYTAFCDTFGLTPGTDPQSWTGKTGYCHILLKKKDGYTNMVPRWILGDDGYVLNDVKRAANGGLNNSVPQQAQQLASAFGGSVSDGNGNQYGNYPF